MEVDESSNFTSAFVTFSCSVPGCVRQYRLYSNLVKHHDRGDHLFKPDKVTLRDRAIRLYKDRADSVKPVPIHQLKNFNIVHSTSVSDADDDDVDGPQNKSNRKCYFEQQGWALSESKNISRYSPEQIKYLTDKYDEGEASGHKWNSSAVSSVSNLKLNELYT